MAPDSTDGYNNQEYPCENEKIVRDTLYKQQIKFRHQGLSPEKLRKVQKALRTLHRLEFMAVNIYRWQISKQPTELNRHLIAAMANEITHLQDFQIKLAEYQSRPSIFRWPFYFVGMAIGLTSRLLGTNAILKAGIWTEKKATSHYSEILHNIEPDPETKKIIEKDALDEQAHINLWQSLLNKAAQP